MATGFNTQAGGGEYRLQFETTNKDYFLLMQKTARRCVDHKPMTNADRLDAMSIKEKAEFLYSIAYAGETPWSKPFYEKFCDQCPAPEYTLDGGRKLNLHECEFKDGKCPHGGDIVWWLQQPAEEGDHPNCGAKMDGGADNG